MATTYNSYTPGKTNRQRMDISFIYNQEGLKSQIVLDIQGYHTNHTDAKQLDLIESAIRQGRAWLTARQHDLLHAYSQSFRSAVYRQEKLSVFKELGN